ncbi:MAG: hypothetical protein Q7W45_01640 [Bacteroidota bacterium]|nr:hypothetical protein [Bacteroidota bacterium]MDP3144545.1 hypothetical protein [Bacteroidota bacterium]MDP3555788.1 hypothetical protein [Bacteroidota bacterium]
MKKQIILRVIPVTIIISMFSCTEPDNKTASAQIDTKTMEPQKAAKSTIEELGETFFMAVSQNDKSHIESSVPSKQDVITIMTDFKGTEKEKKDILKRSEENTKQIRRNALTSIDEIINKGKKNGIDWSKCSFSNSELKVKKENNIEFCELLINFQYNNETYKLRIPECIKSNRGWLIFDKPKWVGK